MIKSKKLHKQALEEHNSVYKNASIVKQCKNAEMYNAYAQCNDQT